MKQDAVIDVYNKKTEWRNGNEKILRKDRREKRKNERYEIFTSWNTDQHSKRRLPNRQPWFPIVCKLNWSILVSSIDLSSWLVSIHTFADASRGWVTRMFCRLW